MSGCLSHVMGSADLDSAYDAAKDRIEGLTLSLEEIQKRITMLDELKGSKLGQFLLVHKGFNGEVTEYVIGRHPKEGRAAGTNMQGEPVTPIEDFFLNHAPTALATQERGEIFIEELQKRCKEGSVIGCVPAGTMWEVFSLNVSDMQEFTMIGVDIDQNSIDLSGARAKEKGLEKHVQLQVADAWEYVFPQKANVLVSNGLNIYEKDDEKVEALFRKFCENLEEGGTLITDTLTPPAEWSMSEINQDDLEKQRILFTEVIAVGWQCFRTVDTTIEQLKKAGFQNVEVRYDKRKMMPTLIATK